MQENYSFPALSGFLEILLDLVNFIEFLDLGPVTCLLRVALPRALGSACACTRQHLIAWRLPWVLSYAYSGSRSWACTRVCICLYSAAPVWLHSAHWLRLPWVLSRAYSGSRCRVHSGLHVLALGRLHLFIDYGCLGSCHVPTQGRAAACTRVSMCLYSAALDFLASALGPVICLLVFCIVNMVWNAPQCIFGAEP